VKPYSVALPKQYSIFRLQDQAMWLMQLKALFFSE